MEVGVPRVIFCYRNRGEFLKRGRLALAGKILFFLPDDQNLEIIRCILVDEKLLVPVQELIPGRFYQDQHNRYIAELNAPTVPRDEIALRVATAFSKNAVGLKTYGSSQLRINGIFCGDINYLVSRLRHQPPSCEN